MSWFVKCLSGFSSNVSLLNCSQDTAHLLAALFARQSLVNAQREYKRKSVRHLVETRSEKKNALELLGVLGRFFPSSVFRVTHSIIVNRPCFL